MNVASHHSLEITALDRVYIPKILSFIRRYYGENVYGADETYFDWQYLQAPCGWFEPAAASGQIPVNAILNAEGELQALHCYLPFDARTPWGGRRGVWDLEWINGSEIRGAGRALARHLLNGTDVYAGFGSNDLAEAAFRKMGMTTYHEIERRVAILDRHSLANLTAAAGYESEAAALPENVAISGDAYHLLESTAAIPKPVIERETADHSFGVTRSYPWLAWRYDRHPYIRYAAVGADPDGHDGVAMIRVECVFGTSAVTCRMIDFFAMPGRERSLLGAAVGFAQAQNALILDYYTTSRSRAAAFDARTSGRTSGILANPRVPYMYQPIAFNERNAMNLVIGAGPQAPANVPFDAFHATKGDSDQDILRTPESGPKLQRRNEAAEDRPNGKIGGSTQ